MQCDMCDSEAKVRASIEGAEMSVCDSCAGFGRVISKILPPKKEVKSERRVEKVLLVRKGFSNIIKSARESRGLKQEDLAKKLAEKVSVLHQLETGHLKPDISLARKLEKFLGVSLLEEYEESFEAKKNDSEGMTLGDFIKVR